MESFLQFQIFVSNEMYEKYMDAFENLVPAIWENDAGQLIGICKEPKDILCEKLKPILEAYSLELPKMVFTDMEQKDWLKENQRGLPTVDIGRFTISNGEKKTGKISIILDATSAFGSGHHDTTAGCVKILDSLTFQPENALDVGTGSGVLAICMEKLWGIPIIACDNNPHCVEVTKKNIAVNECRNIECVESDGLIHHMIQEKKSYDLIVANILTEPLCQLAGQIADALAEDGLFICSGVLQEQVRILEEAYEEAGLSLKKIHKQGDWAVCQFFRTAR